MQEIIKNATVKYYNGTTETFEAIQITDKGVVFGRYFKESTRVEFLRFGFIPKNSILQIKDESKKTIQ